jgi:ubiquinone biosynthesis protein
MVSVFFHLRGIMRLFFTCRVILGQFMIPKHFRLLFGAEAKKQKDFVKYLAPEKPRMNLAEIISETMQKLGPTYIKFGQFLSIRPDLINPEYCEVFKKLQDHVPPFPFEQVRQTLWKELNRDPAEIFSEFDETVMAAASVAQVHRARLMTGEEVAVKVQRPYIREMMLSDLFIMMRFAHLIELFVPSLRKNHPVMLVKEFTRWTDLELYFRQEGKKALLFACNFRDYAGVKVPKVYREFTTKKVLVMEYIRGVNVSHATEQDVDRKAVARLIADSMLKQIFIDGFFHGDPHAGNILLVDRETIAYLDFGIMGFLSKDLRSRILDILYGMSVMDVTRVIATLMEICDASEEDIDMASYRRDINEVLSELPVYEYAGVPFTLLLQRFLNTSLAYGINIPCEFVLASKAISTFESTCLSLDPDIKIVDQLRSFVKEYTTSGFSFEEIMKQLKAGPYELKTMKHMISKHVVRTMKFLENPTLRLASARDGALGSVGLATGVNIAYGFIIAALVLFAGIVSNESDLERWLRSHINLPAWPILSLASLAAALFLLITLLLKNRNRTLRKYHGGRLDY